MFYYSRDNKESLDAMLRVFGSNSSITYFIEHLDTHKWLSSANTWTNNPHWAMKFKNEMRAITHANSQYIKDYYITEHEFVSSYE